jgi:mycothiol synthase
VLDDDLTIRAATLGDADGLADFLTDCAVTYLGRPSSRQEALERLTVAGPDPEQSAVVAVTREYDIVGFGNVWAAAPNDIKCFARVAPELTGRGIGTALLERLEERARELTVESDGTEPPVLTATQWARDTAGPGLFRSRGYSEARFFLRMIADDLESIDKHLAPLPAGITVRPFQPGEEEDLYDAWRETFADEWGQSHVDAEEWWRERRELETAAYDPSLWFVAAGDRIAGFVIAREELGSDGRAGYVSDIGVRPASRGSGLGYALLVQSLAEFHRRGLGSVALNVDADNRTSALRLYRKAGMREAPNFTIWALQLD